MSDPESGNFNSNKFYALSLLTPWEIDVPRVRIGPNHDGGYILADRFDPTQQPVMSYGIAKEYEFDREMAKRGHQVFMFDHTIEGIVDTDPLMRWYKEGVSGEFDSSRPKLVNGVDRPEENLYSIESHLERMNISGNRIILKMDVESAEFGALSYISDEALQRFEQITLEVHALGSLDHSILYQKVFISLFERINRFFTLFHVHANNCDGPESYVYVGGMPISNLIELSYVRTDTVNRSQNNTVYPTLFDYPGQKTIRDKLMWIYPFLPAYPTAEAFRESWQYVQDTDPDVKSSGYEAN
jgi:hypothetical protein